MNSVNFISLSNISPYVNNGAHLLIRIALAASAVWTAVIASELAIRGIAYVLGKRGDSLVNSLKDYHLRPFGANYARVSDYEHKTYQLVHTALQIALATALLWEFTDRQFGSAASLCSRLVSPIYK